MPKLPDHTRDRLLTIADRLRSQAIRLGKAATLDAHSKSGLVTYLSCEADLIRHALDECEKTA